MNTLTQILNKIQPIVNVTPEWILLHISKKDELIDLAKESVKIHLMNNQMFIMGVEVLFSDNVKVGNIVICY